MVNADVSANGGNTQLFADLTGKPVVDLTMTWHRSLRPVHCVGKDRVAAAFPRESASVPSQVVQQFVPFHLDGVPA